MNFQGNFKKVATVDIAPLKDLVLQLTPQHWASNTTRQNRYEVHQDTRMIGLVYDDDFRHTNPTRLPPMQLFGPVLQPMLAIIANHYESLPEAKGPLEEYGHGHFIRASLVCLIPGGEITPHQDKNFSLAHSHRVHIPVVTNEKVLFTVSNETMNMKEGEIIEINNRRLHFVINGGRDGRVHLILDWVTPAEPCCCSYKTHPGVPCSPRACIETDRLKIPCNCFPEDQSSITPDLH